MAFRLDPGGSSRQGHTQTTASRRARAYADLKHEAKTPVRPGRFLIGMDAALEEYRHFKAAGMLNAWRERWKGVLHPR
jgi:hypothetical protein